MLITSRFITAFLVIANMLKLGTQRLREHTSLAGDLSSGTSISTEWLTTLPVTLDPGHPVLSAFLLGTSTHMHIPPHTHTHN